MSPLPAEAADIAEALRRYDLALERAGKAARTALMYESQATRPPESMQPFRLRMAALHRRSEQRQRACARLYRHYAIRLLRWHTGGASTRRPVFMTVVADQIRMESAVVILFDEHRHELLAAVSDATARTVHDTEAVLGDGPALDIAAGTDEIFATDADLSRQWPEFGSAVSNLGIRTVLAVPLRVGSRRLGALCGYSREFSSGADILGCAAAVADTLTTTVLLGEQDDKTGDFPLRGTFFDDADYPNTIDQATGLVAAQHGRDLDAALALLRARAFAEGVPLTRIADQVLRDGRLR
ncbi:GAF domain-containing protein [Nocardia sp. CDC153]|uniref:GAF domain-containing protein n=1 Tax=Nocardia sp. CDC153 TaxID=3112167 RepID=UPI002DB7517A|nr:GAF domain-containing protein [Nocardia sp. CDC153]MEC3954848.1 GAF domain-containing protein [Nocardia sp. CDC153]